MTMRRSVWLCLLALFAASSSFVRADEIYIPANTPTTGGANSWPFSATSSRTEWRYQLVINPSFLGNQAATLIDIAFAPTTSGTHTATTFEVRMSHTTAATSSTFAVNLPTPVQVLYKQNWIWSPVAATWTSLGLASPFNYNGKDRLCIDIRYVGGALSNGFGGACYYDTGAHDRTWLYGTSGVWNAATGSVGAGSGLKMRITVSRAQLIPGGTGQPGSLLDLNLLAPSDAGRPYQVGTSLGAGPIPIGNFKLELSPDDLLVASTSGALPMIFRNYAGLLDASGKALARLAIPAIPALKGVRLYSAFLTIDPAKAGGVSQVSPNALVTIQ
jgi:hypothetical protein